MVSTNKVQVQSCRLLGEIHGEINALPVNIYRLLASCGDCAVKLIICITIRRFKDGYLEHDSAVQKSMTCILFNIIIFSVHHILINAIIYFLSKCFGWLNFIFRSLVHIFLVKNRMNSWSLEGFISRRSICVGFVQWSKHRTRRSKVHFIYFIYIIHNKKKK